MNVWSLKIAMAEASDDSTMCSDCDQSSCWCCTLGFLHKLFDSTACHAFLTTPIWKTNTHSMKYGYDRDSRRRVGGEISLDPSMDAVITFWKANFFLLIACAPALFDADSWKQMCFVSSGIQLLRDQTSSVVCGSLNSLFCLWASCWSFWLQATFSQVSPSLDLFWLLCYKESKILSRLFEYESLQRENEICRAVSTAALLFQALATAWNSKISSLSGPLSLILTNFKSNFLVF